MRRLKDARRLLQAGCRRSAMKQSGLKPRWLEVAPRRSEPTPAHVGKRGSPQGFTINTAKWLRSRFFGFPASLIFVIVVIRRQELVRRERVGPDIKHLAGHRHRLPLR